MRARDRAVAALDAILEEPLLWDTPGSLDAWAEADAEQLKAFFSDAVYELLEEGAYKPPPPAIELVADAHEAIEVLAEQHNDISADKLVWACRAAILRLRQALKGLEVIPQAVWPRLLLKSKKVLVLFAAGLSALPVAVGSGVAVDVCKDVIRYGTFDVAYKGDDEPAKEREPNPDETRRTQIDEAILRAQLRKAEAEAALAEEALTQMRSQSVESE